MPNGHIRQLLLFILVAFLGSQVYWIARLALTLRRRGRTPTARNLLSAGAVAVYLFLAAFTYEWLRHHLSATSPGAAAALGVGPCLCLVVSSTVAFLVLLPVWLVAGLVRVATWKRPPSPSRRQFLQHTATAVATAPFVAGSYGLLYGRVNLEVTRHRVRLGNLPKSFAGFRIVQLSDIHIGPFMSGEEIRKYVGIANALKPDLIVLTGDFVTFDPHTQFAVVDALSSLSAPCGVFGCLGNHDAWSGVEHSITKLFRQRGVRILRTEAVAIQIGNDSINLIGTDFQSHRQFGPSAPVVNLLANIAPLIAPGRVNILLSHNPDTFDRAAELGIDLSLAGHTHGGQVTLEYISPSVSPARLITSYVRGWFKKGESQLYVNRGIGTIFSPIRFGSPPEITVYELKRG